mgnify:FL=1
MAYSAALALSDSALMASFLSNISELRLFIMVFSAVVALFFSDVTLSERLFSAVVALLVSALSKDLIASSASALL